MRGRFKKLIRLVWDHRFVLWMVLYMAFYMTGFGVMERAGHVHYHVIHTWLDEQIPFCEYFIVPYLLWFPFNIGTVAWFVLKADRREYNRLVTALMLGMTAFLVVSVLYPNCLELRPDYVDTSTIFGRLVANLYKTDTPTNVLPSIHVFNTMVLCFAINANETLRRNRIVIAFSNTLGVLIVLSTMFLKQHSVIDVSLGLVMSVICQMLSDRIFETGTRRVPVRGKAIHGKAYWFAD